MLWKHRWLLDCARPLALWILTRHCGRIESARGLAQSKTFGLFAPLCSLLDQHLTYGLITIHEVVRPA